MITTILHFNSLLLFVVLQQQQVRVRDYERASDFLSIWEAERCKMVEMSCELHDEYAANTQFITHLMGRILGEQGLAQTPIDTRGFQSALRLMETTCSDSFDLFYGLYKFNEHSHETLRRLRESFAHVERQLAAKEVCYASTINSGSDSATSLLSAGELTGAVVAVVLCT
jgi:prephenate dehydrogenase